MYKRKGDNLQVVLMGTDWEQCPSPKPTNTDRWGVNSHIYELKEVDLAFNMHMAEHYSDIHKDNMNHTSKMGIPMMMPKVYGEFKTSMAYPLDEIIKEFKSDYFTTVMPYMLAYAIHLGYKKIDCYGLSITGAWEKYKNGKACIEYWIGRAQGKGIEVNIYGKFTECLKAFDNRLYGYEDRFQSLPESINDKPLFYTFGCTLDGNYELKLLKLLNMQKNSAYARNLNAIPIMDNRRILEDTIKYNMDCLANNFCNPETRYVPKWVGDVGFYYMLHAEYVRGVNHNSKFIILEGDRETTTEEWMEKTKDVNLWTSPTSKHWNGHKRGERGIFFPKYDLPKREAFQSYYDHFYQFAHWMRHKFPFNFKYWNTKILDSEEGQTEILKFVGYKKEDMIMGGL